MKQTKSLFSFSLLYILSSTTISAQSISFARSNSNQIVSLESGYYTKSVLVSNLLSDRVGDKSPVIGTAAWSDSGKQFQCRSLLEFNYLTLPKAILDDPSIIYSAELILFPLQIVFSESDADKQSKFIISRVLEPWEDTSTLWINQPAADLSSQVVKVIKKKQKNSPVIVDVTRQVKDMILFGNKGFMISQENSPEKSMALGQLFASPKNDDENLRPMLIIKYPLVYRPVRGYETGKSGDQLIREYDRDMQNQNTMNSTWGSAPVKTTEPVTTPSGVPVVPVILTKPIKD